MKSIFRNISSLILTLILVLIISAPCALAQDNLFDDPLQSIKTHLGEGEEGFEIVDYSQSDWGNLSPELIELLDAETGIDNLNDIAQRAEYNQQEGNVQALVDFLELIVDENGNPLPNDDVNMIINEIRFKGESQINAVILAVAKVLRNLLGSLAALWIVISGVQMILAQGDESKITEQRRSITYAVIGLGIVLLLERLIVLIYGVAGVERGLVVTEEVNQEILGVVSFIKALIGSIAILMIVVSGIKTIAAQGEEEQITTQHKSIMWVIVGLVLIVVNKIFVDNLYIEPAKKQILEQEGTITQTNVQNIVGMIGTITQFALGFVGVIAFGILIYGAGMMITNYGNDEMVQKAKKVIKNAIIGIIVIISAFAIVSTVII